MTYTDIINTIDNKRRFGRACGRDVTREMMEALGHPDEGIHIIHIAGTNGKGSVAAFVSSILQAASFSSNNHYKVGLFTSPHLVEYTERIQIDGHQIPRDDVVRLGELLLDLDLKKEPTMFDYWLAMAILYFKEQNVKYVVLETGLGGRLDSTNGLTQLPEVCAITSIGLEHTQYLGNTLAEIAGEKAGIIKPGVPVVIGKMDDEPREVIIDRSKELNSPYIVSKPVETGVELGLFGEYQRFNAGVAVDIVHLLQDTISENDIEKGLATVVWPGRMQILSRTPFILIDGAHNPNGVMALRDSLMAEFPNQRFSFIMAVMADKDYLEMAHIVMPIASRFYTVTVDYSRSKQADTLAEELRDIGADAQSCDSYNHAVDLASTYNDRIIAFGSLYFIGEIIHDKDEGRGV